ncbi:VOC family protein [Leeuwenhoekiella sp. NPDC079379]|uniref:VOC family protein n=1 Tax=Leeuwenhoekiella sp. NPDC079379 TaxID=3364122 RepID=UPI0037C60108
MSTTSRIRGIDHIGITVPNVTEASQFLKQAFDAKTLYDLVQKDEEPMEGEETEKQLGIPQGAKVVHMKLMQLGKSATLELFEFENTSQKKPVALNDFGITHFAVYVDDITYAAKRFKTAGGELLSQPHGLGGIEKGPHNAGVYGRAPWGSLIELITYPDGLQTEYINRWTPPQRN